MTVTKEMSLEELSDLPNFKASFSEPMKEMGIASIMDLREILMDDSRTKALIEGVSGVGPKIVELWRNAILESQNVEEEFPMESQKEIVHENEALEEEAVDPSSIEIGETRADEQSYLQSITEEEPSDVETEMITSSESSLAPQPHNLNCSIDDLYDLRQTLVDLLQWNGAKKKGVASTIRYVDRKLKDAQLNVSMIEDDDGDPVVFVASKGTGGPVLWGHLDTASEGDMESDLQGVVALDFIYGRGAVDMKGAMAALLCAVQRMASWDEPFTVVLTTDGLDKQEGAQLMANNPLVEQSKGVLMLAPTDMTPVYGQLGRVAMNVTISGEDSILDTSALLNELKQSRDKLQNQQWLRVGLIRGGKRKAPFDPVDSCQASFEILTSYPTRDTVKLVEDVLSNTDHITEIMQRSEPLELDSQSKLVKEVEDIIGKKARLFNVSTEANKLSPSITNICIIGPGNPSSSRSCNEFVVLTDLEKTYELILSLVDRLGGAHRPEG